MQHYRTALWGRGPTAGRAHPPLALLWAHALHGSLPHARWGHSGTAWPAQSSPEPCLALDMLDHIPHHGDEEQGLWHFVHILPGWPGRVGHPYTHPETPQQMYLAQQSMLALLHTVEKAQHTAGLELAWQAVAAGGNMAAFQLVVQQQWYSPEVQLGLSHTLADGGLEPQGGHSPPLGCRSVGVLIGHAEVACRLNQGP